MLTEKRTLIRNTVANGLAQTLAMVAAFVFMPMLVRSFGLVHYGLFVLISAVTGYAALLDLGIGTALTTRVAEGEASGDYSSASRAVSTSLAFYSLAGLAVALLMVVIGAGARQLFHVSAAEAVLLRNMLWIGAFFQLFQWPASTARHVLAGRQRYDVVAVGSVLGTVLNVASTVFVLWLNRGPVLLVALNGMSAAVASAFMAGAVIRASSNLSLRASLIAWPTLRSMLIFSWGVFVVQLSDVLFYQQTDRIILGVLAGAVAVGLYEASAKINALVTYLSGLTVSAVVPLAANMDAAGHAASLRSLFVRGTRYGTAFIAPMALVAVVLADPLLVSWLGDAYRGQGTVLQVLVFPHILVVLGVMGDAIVISQGRMGRRVPYIIGQAVLNVVLSVVLVERIGVLGVAIGTATAHLVDFPIHVRFLLKETGVSFASWLREVVVPVYALLLLPFGVSLVLARTPLVGSLVGVFLVAVAALGAYWLAFYLFGMSSGEKDDLRRIMRARRAASESAG